MRRAMLSFRGSGDRLVASRRAAFVALTVVALGGCASESFSMRRLPSETPAADNAAAVKAAAAMAELVAKKADADNRGAQPPANGTAANSGSGSAAAAIDSNAEPIAPPVTTADAPSMYTYDPWDRLNRFTYRFNARFDESVFLPVANGYRRVPGPIRSGVHNFFANLGEIPSFGNYILQLRFPGGARSLGRFVINSTIGIGGLFDVATRLKLVNPPTGFSATLSTWGMHPGPYLVVPLLGPSTLRDGAGYLGDYGISYGVNILDLYRGNVSWALGPVNAVDIRANTGFRYYATGSPFEYETIRFLYVRKDLIEDEALHRNSPRKNRNTTAPAGR